MNERGAAVYELRDLDRQRYVGDSSNLTVHDRWHTDCENCLMEDLIERGVAVAFEPDTLDQALGEGFEYCPSCIDRTEPDPPDWARS